MVVLIKIQGANTAPSDTMLQKMAHVDEGLRINIKENNKYHDSSL